ncbi:hypothetical protein S7335_137 [Synechococcus sp. PCC 7335]|nr:hypothetical protein S7335_137 [Synechococcus sp. PCC 7335]
MQMFESFEASYFNKYIFCFSASCFFRAGAASQLWIEQ